jgi:hypothetical protein
VNGTKTVLIASSFLCAGNALGQSVEKEPAAVVEFGGAADWNFKDRGSSFGPTIAVEVTPIENWLELEAGVTPLFTRHSTEWNTDLLFKKPWTLSKKAEFMLGVGPEWVHTTKYGITTNSVSGEVGESGIGRKGAIDGMHTTEECLAENLQATPSRSKNPAFVGVARPAHISDLIDVHSGEIVRDGMASCIPMTRS